MSEQKDYKAEIAKGEKYLKEIKGILTKLDQQKAHMEAIYAMTQIVTESLKLRYAQEQGLESGVTGEKVDPKTGESVNLKEDVKVTDKAGWPKKTFH